MEARCRLAIRTAIGCSANKLWQRPAYTVARPTVSYGLCWIEPRIGSFGLHVPRSANVHICVSCEW